MTYAMCSLCENIWFSLNHLLLLLGSLLMTIRSHFLPFSICIKSAAEEATCDLVAVSTLSFLVVSPSLHRGPEGKAWGLGGLCVTIADLRPPLCCAPPSPPREFNTAGQLDYMKIAWLRQFQRTDHEDENYSKVSHIVRNKLVPKFL